MQTFVCAINEDSRKRLPARSSKLGNRNWRVAGTAQANSMEGM